MKEALKCNRHKTASVHDSISFRYILVTVEARRWFINCKKKYLNNEEIPSNNKLDFVAYAELVSDGIIKASDM